MSRVLSLFFGLSYLSELFKVVLDVLECGLGAEATDEDLFGPGHHLKKGKEKRGQKTEEQTHFICHEMS